LKLAQGLWSPTGKQSARGAHQEGTFDSKLNGMLSLKLLNFFKIQQWNRRSEVPVTWKTFNDY
jgi:hypothetical protein